MKKLMICTALATCIGTFPIAADADKLVANSDTGVNVRAMEDHLGIDRDQKHVVGYVLTENETVVETTTEARGGILANSELTEAEKNAAADADVEVETTTSVETEAQSETEADAQAEADVEADSDTETSTTTLMKSTETKVKSSVDSATDADVKAEAKIGASLN